MSDVGDGNTVLGSYADVTSGLITNSIAIGFNSIVDQSDKVRIGDDNIQSIGGMVGWTAFSDSRFKKNVQANVSGLDFILKLNPVTYNVDMHKLNDFYHFNDKFKNEKNKNLISRINGKGSALQEKILYSGFLAQEVEKAAKEAGYNFSGIDKPIDENHSVYGLRYGEFTVPIVKAIQELNSKLDSIIKSKEKDKKIEELAKKLDDLTEQMKNIEAVLSKCCPNVSKKGILLKNGE
jgi:trimeric autotransporter adhesin